MRNDIREQIHDLLSELSMCWSKPEQAGTFDQHRFMNIEDRVFALVGMSEDELDARLEEEHEKGFEAGKEESCDEAHNELFEDLTSWLEKQKSQRLLLR